MIFNLDTFSNVISSTASLLWIVHDLVNEQNVSYLFLFYFNFCVSLKLDINKGQRSLEWPNFTMKSLLFAYILCGLLSQYVLARRDFCKLAPNPGPCNASMLHFYYDTSSHACQEFYYGGCKGNSNRFREKKQCEEACQ
ncbi:hypothetical protein Btru_043118 [Bulinus truncatus]|nr:hypothetical protein Btru_043118 [Bulinus truncatus]